MFYDENDPTQNGSLTWAKLLAGVAITLGMLVLVAVLSGLLS